MILAAPPAVEAQAPDALAQAAAARRGGRAAEALAILSPLTAARAQDADLWLEIGLADFALGRLAEADAALARALALAPGYGDAQIAYARTARARGEPDEALRRLRPAAEAEPANAEARALLAEWAAAPAPVEAESAALRWRLDAVAGYSRLSARRAPWREYDVALSGRLTPATSAGVSVERSERFGLADTLVLGRVDHLFPGRASAYLGVGGAPGARFRPQWEILGGGASPPFTVGLPSAWTAMVGIDAAWARYPVGDVRTLAPYVTLAGPSDLRLTAQLIETVNERDASLTGYRLKAEWAPAPRFSLAAAYADAPESDTGITQQVQAYSLAVGYELSPRFALKLIGVRETRPGLNRDEIDLALTHRF